MGRIEDYFAWPDARGRFGDYGGSYVAETLIAPLAELNATYQSLRADPAFIAEFERDLKYYVGRPSPIYHAERLSNDVGGAQILLKREDLNHTGAHKINNTIGQALVARHMNWLQKLVGPRARSAPAGKGKVPEGLWEKCDGCGAVLYKPELEAALMVCPKCGHHHAIRARARLAAFFDEGPTQELFASLEPIDPLKFRDSKKYKDRIVAAQKQTGEKDALIAMRGKLKGNPLVACAFDFAYMLRPVENGGRLSRFHRPHG